MKTLKLYQSKRIMFAFLKKKNPGKNKELNELIAEIQMNMENNYKDAAQQAYKQFGNSVNVEVIKRAAEQLFRM